MLHGNLFISNCQGSRAWLRGLVVVPPTKAAANPSGIWSSGDPGSMTPSASAYAVSIPCCRSARGTGVPKGLGGLASIQRLHGWEKFADQSKAKLTQVGTDKLEAESEEQRRCLGVLYISPNTSTPPCHSSSIFITFVPFLDFAPFRQYIYKRLNVCWLFMETGR